MTLHPLLWIRFVNCAKATAKLSGLVVKLRTFRHILHMHQSHIWLIFLIVPVELLVNFLLYQSFIHQLKSLLSFAFDASTVWNGFQDENHKHPSICQFQKEAALLPLHQGIPTLVLMTACHSPWYVNPFYIPGYCFLVLLHLTVPIIKWRLSPMNVYLYL